MEHTPLRSTDIPYHTAREDAVTKSVLPDLRDYKDMDPAIAKQVIETSLGLKPVTTLQESVSPRSH